MLTNAQFISITHQSVTVSLAVQIHPASGPGGAEMCRPSSVRRCSSAFRLMVVTDAQLNGQLKAGLWPEATPPSSIPHFFFWGGGEATGSIQFSFIRPDEEEQTERSAAVIRPLFING